MMRKYLQTTLLGFMLLILAIGCTTVEYAGETREPTASIHVFRSTDNVTQSYLILGELTGRAQANKVSIARMESAMEKAAKKRGADAIVFTEVDEFNVKNRDRGQEFVPEDERASFGPEPYDTVRRVKATLLKYN